MLHVSISNIQSAAVRCTCPVAERRHPCKTCRHNYCNEIPLNTIGRTSSRWCHCRYRWWCNFFISSKLKAPIKRWESTVYVMCLVFSLGSQTQRKDRIYSCKFKFFHAGLLNSTSVSRAKRAIINFTEFFCHIGDSAIRNTEDIRWALDAKVISTSAYYKIPLHRMK